MKFRYILCMLVMSVVAAPVSVLAGAGDLLVSKTGMTLYTFDLDKNGKSACSGGCLAVWPAARPGDVSGKEFGVITRDDGSKQLTYQDKPLYYFINDKKPGDANGDNVQGTWHAVRPHAKRSGNESGNYYSSGY